MLDRFLTFIKEKQLFESHHRLLLAVSGGLDSVVMVDLCQRAGLNFGIAHCNFQLRANESEADEEFVRSIALQYNAPFFTKRFDTKAVAKLEKISTQMAARNLRYQWFEEVRLSKGFDWILTAHHQDDLLETLLLNMVRGTGLAGLHGILPKNGAIVRPLLFTTRHELADWANENALLWREDNSNLSDDYARNRLRHHVVPILKDLNPQVAQATMTLAERVSENEAIVKHYLSQEASKSIRQEQGSLWIDIRKLEGFVSPLECLAQWLSDYGFSYLQTKHIWESRHQTSGKQYFSSTHTLSKDRTHWIVSKTEHISMPVFAITTPSGSVHLPQAEVSWEITDIMGENTPHTFYISIEALSSSLVLRPWKAGDWFCPKGMRGKRKKLSDFLIDNKVPFHHKKSVYVLESKEEIRWVVGYRPAEPIATVSKISKYLKFFLRLKS
ncbi:MAG: tRNA lysidine(34) synthetase TilS [Runella sp.]